MPTYRYRALYPSGRKLRGVMAAGNESELINHLNQAGLELLDLRVAKDHIRKLHGQKRISPRALAQFASQMTDLLKAGLSFVDALGDMAQTTIEPALRDTLEQIIRDIQHGSAISAAFAKHTTLFPGIFLAILSSGEASGDLSRTFAYLKDYTETRARMGENLRRALRYPLFLIVVAFGVVAFMMAMVVPQIIQFLLSINGELPLTTRMLITASNWLLHWWWLLGLVIIFLMTTSIFLHRHSPQAAFYIDHMLLKLPAFGSVLHKLALARFAHSFGILYQSGGNIPDSLNKARTTVYNHYLFTQLDAAERQIQNGQPLSTALQNLFPSFAARMIRIGEQSGQLGKSLMDIAHICDRQAADVTERFIGALEPTLTLIIGSVLAWVVLAVFGPIYGSLAKLVGNG